MPNQLDLSTRILHNGLRTVFALALLCALLIGTLLSAQAQTFTVIHNFTGAGDGANPYAGLAMDGGGNLYGTTFRGGNGNGVVYKMTHTNGSWTLAPLYKFAGSNDGSNPYAGVVVGPNGSLYGTTTGGGPNGEGTVFNLTPPSHLCSHISCSWTETLLYSFQGGTDGAVPYGSVKFDQAGNIYGTTAHGGMRCGEGCGTVYQLTPLGGGWTESIIYAFSVAEGQMPLSGVILDNTGNLYGTTLAGGDYYRGTVYEFTYSAGSGWAESFLYSFGHEGVSSPYAGLIFDLSGNLYGTTAVGPDGGEAFELTPADGTWTYSLLYDFGSPETACGPRAALVMDRAGNFYGTTYCDGDYSQGSVFRLTHVNDGWTYTPVYSFTGRSDGGYPVSNVVIDANGDLYGTTSEGGQYNAGVVWEITP